MNYRKLRNAVPGLVPVLLLCACGSSDQSAPAAAAPVQTAEGQKAADVPADATSTGAPAAAAGTQAEAGVRVFIDPATGQVREPTPAELRTIEARKQTPAPGAITSSKPAPKTTVLPNGWVAVELDTEVEMKGCVQKDGRIVAGHECKNEAPTAVTRP